MSERVYCRIIPVTRVERELVVLSAINYNIHSAFYFVFRSAFSQNRFPTKEISSSRSRCSKRKAVAETKIAPNEPVRKKY